MKKDLTELVFIIDRSGSMSGLEADTIGGFNSLIEKQKKEEGKAVVSTVLFSTHSRVVHDRVPLSEIGKMTDDDLLIITADHGCDPAFKGTDHTREKVPCLIYSKSLPSNGNLGEITGFDSIASYIREWI